MGRDSSHDDYEMVELAHGIAETRERLGGLGVELAATDRADDLTEIMKDFEWSIARLKFLRHRLRIMVSDLPERQRPFPW